MMRASRITLWSCIALLCAVACVISARDLQRRAEKEAFILNRLGSGQATTHVGARQYPEREEKLGRAIETLFDGYVRVANLAGTSLILAVLGLGLELSSWYRDGKRLNSCGQPPLRTGAEV